MSETLIKRASCFSQQLGKNKIAQKKLFNEIKGYTDENGFINYDFISKMTYLDQIISETLRLYPTVSLIYQKCIKSTFIGGQDDGILIEKDTLVLIPIYSIQRDPLNYRNPEKFIPERFNLVNNSTIPMATMISMTTAAFTGE